MTFEPEAPTPRLAYLVRCWLVETEQGLIWRASFEDPHSTRRRNFADLGALFAFLEGETEALIPAKKELSQ